MVARYHIKAHEVIRMNQNLIHTPVGVRDIYGQENYKKQRMEEKIHSILMRYGYEDIQTPAFEFFEVFSRDIGTTNERELYKFFDKEGNTLVLRPDFTPSIARCAAKYFSEEKNPIRFSYLGNTYTNTNELQGKLKEMTEMGAELIGDDSVEADAEIIAMVVDSLLTCGLEQFQISVGDVEYFKGLCQEVGLSEETERDLRDYISIKNMFGAQEYLLNKGLEQEKVDKLIKMFDLFGGKEILSDAAENVVNARSLNAIGHLQNLYEKLCLYGVEKYISFDLGMLSKYHYYTGVIFKGYTYGVGDAIVKGGRYDNLLEKFGKKSAAIGYVILIDEMLNAMQRQKISFDEKNEIETIEYTDATYEQCLKTAMAKRAAGQKVKLCRKCEE